jgi:hypothetical protein
VDIPDPLDPEQQQKYDYLNQVLFSGAQPQLPKVPAEGIRRYGQLAMRGATLGFGGTQAPAESFGESAAEMAGSIPTIAGISALTSPVVAAGGRVMGPLGAALRVPVAQRVTGAAVTGGIVGTATAISENKPILEEAGKTAASYAALEGLFLGGASLLKKGLKAPPAGRTLTEPNLTTMGEQEMLRGQGLAPETPPGANLPVLSKKNFFDPYDFVGSGTVLNPERNPQLRKGRILTPEEQTRSMLPPGPSNPLALGAPIEEGVIVPREGQTRSMLMEGPAPPKALPPASDRLLPAGRDLESLFGIDLETGMGRARPETSPRQGPIPLGPGAGPEVPYFETGHLPEESAYFSQVFDPHVNAKVLIPKTQEAEEAATVALGMNPRMDELPLTPGQVKNLETVQKADKLKMDTVSKREGAETSALLKQPDNIVEESLTTSKTPIAETHTIELTPSGLEARELLTRSGIAEDEFIKFGSTLRGTREEKLQGLLGWLRERCR